jgi:ATP-dependent Clp protease ATP-binding subunit ClpC
MFERFTESARLALSLAQSEARDLRHNFIGTEHLLLGVLGCGDDAVTEALDSYAVSPESVRTRVVELIGPGDADVGGKPPFTARAKKVLELSLREALAMGHDHITSAHVLLGILREGEGVGAQVLEEQGVDADRVRLWIAQSFGDRGPRRRGGRGRRMRTRDIDRLASEAFAGSVAAVRARTTAAALAGPDPLGTHHVLLALLDEPESMAAKVLADLGVTKEQVEAKIVEIGIENTSDAPPKPVPQPTKVALAEGVEIRITDPQLTALVEGGHVEELLAEIVRRARPA